MSKNDTTVNLQVPIGDGLGERDFRGGDFINAVDYLYNYFSADYSGDILCDALEFYTKARRDG